MSWQLRALDSEETYEFESLSELLTDLLLNGTKFGMTSDHALPSMGFRKLYNADVYGPEG